MLSFTDPSLNFQKNLKHGNNFFTEWQKYFILCKLIKYFTGNRPHKQNVLHRPRKQNLKVCNTSETIT